MPTTEIEEFAQLLVLHVRDAAIQNCDRLLEPTNTSPVAKRWRITASERPELLAATIIPDCVDKVLSCFLRAVDQEKLTISFTSATGEVVNLSEAGLGELCGWYNGSPGWRAKYSKERFVDDVSDLTL